ncbi:Carbonic anhydrase 2 [Papilio xuthus]|uniref:Carbonic anhydrase 2 n=1 Tax=Papilio xuthus TaxID=66420 RepID=A0A194PP59_PAPXU|nr:Carbonic anhydrase 2 [Papilio xuthus]
MTVLLHRPATWIEKFPEARGARQSPVDIDTSLASSGGSAPPLLWRYSVNHTRSVVNPGYCWRVDENGYDSANRAINLSRGRGDVKFPQRSECMPTVPVRRTPTAVTQTSNFPFNRRCFPAM